MFEKYHISTMPQVTGLNQDGHRMLNIPQPSLGCGPALGKGAAPRRHATRRRVAAATFVRSKLSQSDGWPARNLASYFVRSEQATIARLHTW